MMVSNRTRGRRAIFCRSKVVGFPYHMKIILVIADERGRNSVFITDDLRVYSLKKAVQLAKEKKFSNVYPVQRRSGTYLRTSRNVPKEEQLETLAVSSSQLFSFANSAGSVLSHLAFNQYLRLRANALKRKESRPYIYIGNIAHLSKKTARKRLKEYQACIFDAANKFEVDPYLLGAIIIDELARFLFFEDVLEKLAVFHIGKDVSAGIAQIKMETARGLIIDEYYNPGPGDPELSSKNVKKTSRKILYNYVKQPKHNIFFAAAHMRALIDRWKKFVDLRKRPEIIATLYSIGRGKRPHGNPKPNTRGLQIAGEFYTLAKVWLP